VSNVDGPNLIRVHARTAPSCQRRAICSAVLQLTLRFHLRERVCTFNVEDQLGQIWDSCSMRKTVRRAGYKPDEVCPLASPGQICDSVKRWRARQDSEPLATREASCVLEIGRVALTPMANWRQAAGSPYVRLVFANDLCRGFVALQTASGTRSTDRKNGHAAAFLRQA
jgi:hypothetical protein